MLVGAGAGLSVAAGFTYSGERFVRYFKDFIAKYGFRDMYAGGFYPFITLEEYWAYWSRYIYINRYQDAPKPVYDDLLDLLQGKAYFVLTSNVDHCFQKAGFDKQRLFYMQGDYGLWQCSRPCHQKTYDNETVVRKMYAEQKNMAVSSELVPYCPVCGAPMSMNLRSDHTFVEDEGWWAAARRYADFLQRHKGQRILFLELIIRISEGNPRIAYMAGRLAINYGISIHSFKEKVLYLSKMEVVEIHLDQVATLSDQCLANYMLYYVFFDKKLISLSSVLEVGYKHFRKGAIRTINTLLN